MESVIEVQSLMFDTHGVVFFYVVFSDILDLPISFRFQEKANYLFFLYIWYIL